MVHTHLYLCSQFFRIYYDVAGHYCWACESGINAFTLYGCLAVRVCVLHWCDVFAREQAGKLSPKRISDTTHCYRDTASGHVGIFYCSLCGSPRAATILRCKVCLRKDVNARTLYTLYTYMFFFLYNFSMNSLLTCDQCVGVLHVAHRLWTHRHTRKRLHSGTLWFSFAKSVSSNTLRILHSRFPIHVFRLNHTTPNFRSHSTNPVCSSLAENILCSMFYFCTIMCSM